MAIARFGTPAAIGCDRYRINELYERLAQIGLAHVPVIPRGMGYRDGSGGHTELPRGRPNRLLLCLWKASSSAPPCERAAP